ncbi:hypothetical protein ACP4OV_001514 [Aristida adscensionis]
MEDGRKAGAAAGGRSAWRQPAAPRSCSSPLGSTARGTTAIGVAARRQPLRPGARRGGGRRRVRGGRAGRGWQRAVAGEAGANEVSGGRWAGPRQGGTHGQSHGGSVQCRGRHGGFSPVGSIHEQRGLAQWRFFFIYPDDHGSATGSSNDLQIDKGSRIYINGTVLCKKVEFAYLY